MTTTPSYDSLVPLRTDFLIEQRVRDLIGRANLRQLWLLFLDEQQVQLPLLLPIDGLPSRPTEDGTARVVDNVVRLMEELGAAGLVVVWERYGPAHLSEGDTEWVRCFASACGAVRLPLRAMLLSHRHGVRWIAADDYLR
ncbi:hypothetical protein B0I08_102346 [Glaciihabitans tibetensis]|uniref:RadC-like JAB domain-containing protein n=1 Tax=Glaciihabitans tibetensis TaxID=1266600 RepID=A0A2T0VHI1_9MICO|nr:hypothetical protein [Glaciihabitans tibetensis]PRY69669.1 hypothetical protein B0I08_102346 [Glaciihabitans tibetensis]